jgi:hypothetical protein
VAQIDPVEKLRLYLVHLVDELFIELPQKVFKWLPLMNLGHLTRVYEEDRNKSLTKNILFAKEVKENSGVFFRASMKLHNPMLSLIDRDCDCLDFVRFIEVVKMN